MAYGLTANAAERPTHVALVDGERRITYAELDRLVNRVARVFLARGVGLGSRVALMLPNSIEFFAVTHAAAKLGALAVPVNYRFRHDEIAHLLSDSGAAVFVVDAGWIDEARPAVETTLVLGECPGYTSLATEIAAVPDTPPPVPMVEGGYNIMIYTSGTTGRPKGVVHPLSDGRAGFEAQKRVVEMWGFTGDDVHLLVGPAYHTLPGAYAAQHLFVGATTVIMRKFDAETCLQLIAAERVTTTGMVPAHFIRILELPPAVRARYDLSSVRRVMHAAAPCPPEVKRRIMEVFPAGAVWEFYGATEGPGTIISPEEWLAHPGSVGRPWPGVTVSILDDDGREVPPGTVGTIYLSTLGARRFSYHNAPEKTAAAFRGDRFTVGDVGYMDADGYLFICDRKADMVISGGVNIYPAEIEAILHAHPGVVDAAVFGIPDARWGEALHAVVELRAPSRVDAEALEEWCRERLADYKCPRSWAFVDELPRDPNGKVQKRSLRAPFWAGSPNRV